MTAAELWLLSVRPVGNYLVRVPVDLLKKLLEMLGF